MIDRLPRPRWFRCVACALAVLLCATTTLNANVRANAAEENPSVEDAQAALNEAEAHMATLVADYEALEEEVNQLRAQIDETSAQALEVQQQVIRGRASLGKVAAYEYRGGGPTRSVIDMVFGESDFTTMVRNLSYLGRIMEYHADEVIEQQERSDQLQGLLDELNAQKDEHDKKLAELEEKKAEAEQTVANASSQLKRAKADEAARVAAMRQAAGGMSSMGNADIFAGGGDVGWASGMASAYGGSTDASTPNPGITASGAICDDWSMGVAIPMAWPNYWQYFGRTVAISYGGQTVLATINDCGYMGAGSRVLDLQPGVWKALGFSSCFDWGLRPVSYRIL